MVSTKTTVTLAATAFDALIFDLDGVITDTASVHAAAWKRMFDDFLAQHAARQGVSFHPFEIETDYRSYVDGKPRFDGVRSFLQSRHINLPEGEPDDPPEAATIQALGRRKNMDFLQQIKEKGADVYDSTVALIHSAKKCGLHIAVISSSRNCAMILDSVHLSPLFEVKVDGVDSEILGIAGKPAPDIFLEAARQLQVEPKRAVVIEDAVSGVQAGRAGNFGMVIGIARGGGEDALLESGADLVVTDLSEVRITPDPAAATPPLSALEAFAGIASQADRKELAIFLDYDGTLTPIVDTPDQAIMAEEMRQAVRELSRHCAVGIISGRDLKDVRDKAQLDTLVYAGSHGFDIAGPEGLQVENRVGEEFLPALDQAEHELTRKLDAVPGLLLERKKFAIAIHFRLVEPERVAEIEKVVKEVAAGNPKLRQASGKKIFELQPRMEWHKGKALLFLLQTLKLDREDVLPFYIGDDVTDEDAFRTLKGRGITIMVQDSPQETAADYTLKNPQEVRQFLLQLIPLARRSS
jgi:alpha,alpha-trehalase